MLRRRYDSVASCSAGSDVADVWEDFHGNGRDSDLDDVPLMSPLPTEQSSNSRDLVSG